MTALVPVIRDQQSVIHARGRRVSELGPKAKRSDEDGQAARRLKKEVEGLNAKVTELQIALAAAGSGLLPAGGRGDPLKPGPCDGAADAAQAPVHPHRRESGRRALQHPVVAHSSAFGSRGHAPDLGMEKHAVAAGNCVCLAVEQTGQQGLAQHQ
ncbi:hypothetical protein DIPPA_15321 [Diplonema papillatum]|nr:hypothetical protein DIPPA_15321 [Diplonema papillatum]